MSTSATKYGIVACVDGSPPESKVAVDWAARDAALLGLPVHLVHVLSSPVVMTFPEVPIPAGYLQWQEDSATRCSIRPARLSPRPPSIAPWR